MLLQIDNLGKVAVTIEEDYWKINKDYDKLTVVEVADRFATYISRIPVPAGTELNNRKYWIPFSSLKEEIVVHYNEWINLFGGLLTSQTEVLNNIQKIINDIYTHLPNGISFEGDINVYDVGESATINLTCATTGNKPASEIKLYKNNILINTWHNVTGFEIENNIDSDAEFRVEAIIDNWTYYASWNVATAYPFYIGTGTNIEDIISNEDYKHKGSEGLNGIYQVFPNDNDNIFIVTPKWIAVPEVTISGTKIPFDNATEYTIDEIVYCIYKSSNQYQEGDYSIKIGTIELDDRVSEIERIVGNREESSVVPTYMGRVTLKSNIKYPIAKGWGIYSYTFDYEGDYTVDVLVYFENGKFYLPYRNVRHPKVINVISQTSFSDQKLDIGNADVNDIAEALNITEETQYLFYDDGDFVVTMPDNSTLSIADVIRDNWPLHNYTEFLDTKNLLTQSMIAKPNTIYVIQYDFDLDEETLEVPENCVLKFEGGSLNNGIVIFMKTVLIKPSFSNCMYYGDIQIEELDDRCFLSTDDNNLLSWLIRQCLILRTRLTLHRDYIIDLSNSTNFVYIESGVDVSGSEINLNNCSITDTWTAIGDSNTKNFITIAGPIHQLTIKNGKFYDINNNTHKFSESSGICILQTNGECSNIILSNIYLEGGDSVYRHGGYTKEQNLVNRGVVNSKFSNIRAINTGYTIAVYRGVNLDIDVYGYHNHRGLYLGAVENARIHYKGHYPEETHCHILLGESVYYKDEEFQSPEMIGCTNIDIIAEIFDIPNNVNEWVVLLGSYGNGSIGEFNFRTTPTIHRNINLTAFVYGENKLAEFFNSYYPEAGYNVEMYGINLVSTDLSAANKVNLISLKKGFVSQRIKDCYHTVDNGAILDVYGTSEVSAKIIIENSNVGAIGRFDPDNCDLEVVTINSHYYRGIPTDNKLKIFSYPVDYTSGLNSLIGATESRPALTLENKGQQYFDTTLGAMITWNGNYWVNENGFHAAVVRGELADRPTSELTAIDEGYQYYATDVHKVIYFSYNGGSPKWYYADGTEVQ